MRTDSENAQLLAEWLAEQPFLEAAHCCGLPDHPGHTLATRQQRGIGGVLAFEVAAGREAAWQVINGTELMSLTVNLGDAKTTIVHPASPTQGHLTAGQREAVGISEGLVRIAAGLEDLEDLQSACLRGLAALGC